MEKRTVTQYSVPVENEPGKLYRVCQVLSREGINVTGIVAESLGDVAFIRFLAEPQERIRLRLEEAGFDVLEREVFPVDLPNRPGELTKLAKALADEDVNIVAVYGGACPCETTRVVVAVDQPNKAQPILARWPRREPAGAQR